MWIEIVSLVLINKIERKMGLRPRTENLNWNLTYSYTSEKEMRELKETGLALCWAESRYIIYMDWIWTWIFILDWSGFRFSTLIIDWTWTLILEWAYGTVHSTDGSVLKFNIFVFKILTVDPNRSTCFPYEYVFADQILHFLEFFYYFFR